MCIEQEISFGSYLLSRTLQNIVSNMLLVMWSPSMIKEPSPWSWTFWMDWDFCAWGTITLVLDFLNGLRLLCLRNHHLENHNLGLGLCEKIKPSQRAWAWGLCDAGDRSRILCRRRHQALLGGGKVTNIWFCQIVSKTAWNWEHFGLPRDVHQGCH